MDNLWEIVIFVQVSQCIITKFFPKICSFSKTQLCRRIQTWNVILRGKVWSSNLLTFCPKIVSLSHAKTHLTRISLSSKKKVLQQKWEPLMVLPQTFAPVWEKIENDLHEKQKIISAVNRLTQQQMTRRTFCF